MDKNESFQNDALLWIEHLSENADAIHTGLWRLSKESVRGYRVIERTLYKNDCDSIRPPPSLIEAFQGYIHLISKSISKIRPQAGLKEQFEHYRDKLLQHFLQLDYKKVKSEDPKFNGRQYDLLRKSIDKHFPSISYKYMENITAVLKYIKIVRTIEGPRNINSAINWKWETHLHIACRYQDTELVRLLLHSGASVNIGTIEGFTPLHFLCKYGDDNPNASEIAQMLIKRHCNVNAKDRCGRTCFYYLDDSKIFKDISSYIDIYVRDNLERTPLHYCKKEFIDSKDGSSRRNRKKEILNAVDIFGMTALHIAITTCSNEVEKKYRHRHQRGENSDLVKYLMAQGAAMDVKSNFGLTPLHMAMFNREEIGIERAVSFLLKQGADPNVTDAFNCSPLHYAVYSKTSTAVIDLLIRSGADLRIRDSRNRTALEYAQELEFKELADVLKLSRGSKRAVPAYQSITEEQLCSRFGHVKLADATYRPKVNERKQLAKEIDKVVRKIMHRVEEIDPRFKCEVSLSGSVNEGTKCGPPDEFDYMLYLHDLSHVCEAEYVKEGEAEIKLTDGIADDIYKAFFNKNGNISGEKIKEILHMHVERVVHEPHIWKDSQLVYFPTGISDSTRPVVLTLMWCGFEFKGLSVSIDLVLTLPLPCKKVNLDRLPSDTAILIRNLGPLIVLVGYEKETHNYSRHESNRFSMSPAEQQILKSLPGSVKKGYKKAKSIRAKIELASYSYRTRESSHVMNEVIQTYPLKTALFYVLHDLEVVSITGGVIRISTTHRVLRHETSDFWCKKIYRCIKDRTEGGKPLTSFFFPDREVKCKVKHVDRILAILGIRATNDSLIDTLPDYGDPSPQLHDTFLDYGDPSPPLHETFLDYGDPSPPLRDTFLDYEDPSPPLHETFLDYGDPSPPLHETFLDYGDPSPQLHDTFLDYGDPSPPLHETFLDYGDPSPPLRDTFLDYEDPSPPLHETFLDYGDPSPPSYDAFVLP